MDDRFWMRAKFMMKPLGLGYQRINMCPNFFLLYHNEYENFIGCKTCQHAWYKPDRGRERILIAYKKLRNFPITLRLQRLFIFLKIIEHVT